MTTMVAAPNLKAELEALAHTTVDLCFQCQKCTCGCPQAKTMEVKPHELVQFLRLGEYELLLTRGSCWRCASCQTCVTRCPHGVDIAALQDALRIHLQRHPRRGRQEKAEQFFRTAVSNIRRFGRMYELGLIGMLKLRTGDFLQDLDLGRRMFFKGKLKLLPSWGRHGKEVRRLFRRADAMRGKGTA